MEGTPRHTLGSHTQHTCSLEDNTRICQEKASAAHGQYNNFRREHIHLTHTDGGRVKKMALTTTQFQ